MDNQSLQRIPVYSSSTDNGTGDERYRDFLIKSGNAGFTKSVWTYFSLAVLIVFFPLLSLLGVVGQDTSAMLSNMTQGVLVFMLIVTILFQWAIFLINYVSTFFEQTGLAGLGLKRIRVIDFAWAGAFFLTAWLILTGLAWILARFGMEIPGEIGLLVPSDPFGKVVWVLVSFTAGFCEEIAYRGYLMTRLRILLKNKTWLIPTIMSAIFFGIGHVYQGWAGFIIITVYGALFSLLYIRTGSLWPCIIAHSIQDLGNLFMPR